MTTRRTIVALAIAVCTVTLGVRFLVAARASADLGRAGACRALQPEPAPGGLQDQTAPDFALQDTAGRTVRLSELRGHPVVLNFWATWCPPCVDEMPSMEEMARRLEGTGIKVVGVSADESWDAVRRFFPHGTALTVLLDSKQETPRRYGTSKYPETFFIDAQGRVRHYIVNKRDWDRPEVLTCLQGL